MIQAAFQRTVKSAWNREFGRFSFRAAAVYLKFLDLSATGDLENQVGRDGLPRLRLQGELADQFHLAVEGGRQRAVALLARLLVGGHGAVNVAP